MKRLLVSVLLLLLVTPVWAEGPVPTRLLDFKAEVGDTTYHEGEVVIVPPGEGVLFKAALYRGEKLPQRFRHVHFSFYDEAGELVYHERDTTNDHGVAQVGIPDIRKGHKIKTLGKYRLKIKYNGNDLWGLAPCELRPVTVIFE